MNAVRSANRDRALLALTARHTDAKLVPATPMSDWSSILALMADDPTRRAARPVRRRLVQLADALEKAAARHAICGAFAMGILGARRFTEDIDVLVDERDIAGLLDALGGALREVGREPAVGAPFQVKLRSRRAAGPGAVDIDLLVPIEPIEQWALDTAIEERAFGRRVKVVTADALVLLKLRAAQDAAESPEAGQHRADAARLLRAGKVDVAGLRRFLASHPLLAELDRLLAAPPAGGRRRPSRE